MKENLLWLGFGLIIEQPCPSITLHSQPPEIEDVFEEAVDPVA